MSDEIKALEERIAKARADRAALDEAAERRVEIARLEKLARAEEQALIDAPHIAEAQEKHGVDRTTVVVTDLGAVVLKKPHHLKWNALVAKGEKMTTADLADLVKSCVVYPAWPAVDKMLEEAPGAMGVIVDAVTNLAKGGAKERSGK